jgi:phosphoglycolate phosphatase
MNTADMWNDFMPELDVETKKEAAYRVGQGMQEEVLKGRARWFEGVEDTLNALRDAGFELAVLSNCGHRYAHNQWEAFKMDRWFTAFFACETWHKAPKHEIIKDIAADPDGALAKSPVKSAEHFASVDDPALYAAAGQAGANGRGCIAAVVGDRGSDLAAGKAIGAPFIGCLYGYGTPEELADSTAFANHAGDIAGLILGLKNR